jgi:hypothetical protein
VKLIIALLMMLAPFAAHSQQLLKCVGKDGKVEYASQCPPETTEMQTGIRNVPSASPAPAQQKSLAEREAEFRKRQSSGAEARQKDEKKAAEAQERQAACEQARTYLKSLQIGNRISTIDPKTGERVFLEDPDRPAEIAKTQRSIDANCK